MELAEVIEAIKGVKPGEFKDALQQGAQSHYQEIFNSGHSVATAAGKTKLEEATARIEELTGAIASKDTELQELASKKPDLEKLKQDYEAKLVKAQEERATLEKEWSEKFSAKERARLKAELISKLQGLHADPWAAQKAIDDSVMDRVQLTDDGYKVYQTDGATPYAPADGQDALDLLASEIVGTIPAALIRPPKNNGSGYGGGKGEGGGNDSTLKRSTATRQQRIAYINEHGLEAWSALPMK